MIDKALAYLAELATKAAAPQKIESGDARTLRYVVNGAVEDIAREPLPRNHKVGSLDDVIALAIRFTSEPGEDGDHKYAPVVWYDESDVVLVIDDEGHRLETATLTLEPSDVFTRLREVAAGKQKFDQRAFVRFLRIDLAGTLDPVVLLEKVRKVEFENGSTVSAAISRQKESLGRSITSQARTDGGDLPENVTLSVPVYKTLGETAPMPCRCSVEVDPAEGTFRLLPLPDELTLMRHVAVGRIAQRLAAGLPETVPAYYGSPA